MKDYSMTEEERNRFILGYSIEGNNIIVNYADGSRWRLPYNEKNENIALEKMRNQVEKSGEFYKKTNNKVKGLSKTLKGLITPLIITILCSIICDINSSDYVICAYTAVGLFGGLTLGSFIKYLKTNYILNDLKINREFLEIEDKLNDNIRKTNENVLANTSRKMQSIVKNTPDESSVFNINSFNNVSYSDIQQVMDNIKRNEEFGFDYSDTSSVIKSKTRARKR